MSLPLSSARIYLFAELTLQKPDGELLNIRSAKLASLLGRLILFEGQPISRGNLARTLWPGCSDASARRNLREYLYRARQVFAQIWPQHEALIRQGETLVVQFPPETPPWVDVNAFQKYMRLGLQASSPEAKIGHLQTARGVYRGDLLSNIDDAWVLAPRARWRRRAIQVIEALAAAMWEQQMPDAAIELAREGVHFEPYHEGFWLQLMGWLLETGKREEAWKTYQQYMAWLDEELGLSPDAALAALGERIQRDAPGGAARAPAVPSSSATRVRPGVDFLPAFVGRQSELLRLHIALQERPQSRVDTIILLGATGVGKTRLMQEWRGELGTTPLVLEGRCHEFEQSMPYLPLLDAIHPVLPLVPWEQLPPASSYAWLAPLAQLLPDLHYYAPDLPPYPLTPDSDTAHYIMEGLAQILLALARQRPVVLLLDDLHWADRSTWGFLPFISRRLRGTRTLIVAAFSTTEADPEALNRLRALQKGRHVQTLTLAHLWPNDVTGLIPPHIRENIASPDAFALKLHQLSGGNPFFITEILRALLESDAPRPYTPETLDQLRLPDAVKSLIQLRLDRLSLESRRVLCMAASIGREFTISLLSRISGLDDETLLTYLDDWLRRGLVVETPGGYDFSQQQIRDVAYQSLSRSRRRRVHRRVAQALEEEAPLNLERVTRHYCLSDTPERAIPGLLSQGQRALNLRSYREAQIIGDTLLEIIQKAPEAAHMQDQVALFIQLGLAYAFRQETDRALEFLGKAARLAERSRDKIAAAEALLRIAQIHWLQGDALQCRPHVERSLAFIEQTPAESQTHLAAAAYRLLGRVDIAQGRFADAATALEKSLRLVEETPQQRLHQVTTQGYLITAYGRLGRAEDVRSLSEALDRATRRLESPSLRGVILVQMGVAFNALDDWEQASWWAKVGLRLCEEQELPVYAFVAKTVLGRAAYFYRKDVKRAYEMLNEAIAWAQRRNYWLFRFMAHVYLAEIALAEGDERTLKQQVAALEAAEARTGNRWALDVARGYWRQLRSP